MTSWILVLFLTYSNGYGVALQSEKVDFASKEDCDAAKRSFDAASNTEGFKRSISFCARRGSFMLAEPK